MGFWDDTWLGRAASNVGSGIASAASAVADSAVALVDGRAVNGVVDAAKWVNDNAIQPAAGWVGENAPKLLEGETWRAAGQGIVDYGKFVVENPVLAARQAGQGLSNSVTGLVGFVADVGIYAVEGTGKLIYNAGAGVVNLGARDGERIVDYAGMSDFSKVQSFMEEHTGTWLGYDRVQLDQMVRDGRITEQEASFAAGTKYGFQAVGEVATFVAVSAATAGAGGAALAAARGSAVGVRVAAAGNALARTGHLGEVVARPLLWAGKDVSLIRGVPYLERAAALAETAAPTRGLASRVLLPGPMRVFQPSQTSHAFASWFGSHTTSGTLGYGLRAAEGTFKFFNPLQANGRSIFAWGIEGGGATLSWVANSARESAELEGERNTDQQFDALDAANAEEQAVEMLRRYGLGPDGQPLQPPAEGGETPPLAPEEQPIENITPGFQDSARRDPGITHDFKINNGLVQPTELDPLGGQRNPDDRSPAPTGPAVGGGNNR